MIGVLIPVDGPALTVEFENSVASLQQLVGGYFELQCLPHVNQNFVIDEDGQAKKLPQNPKASAVVRALGFAGTIRDNMLVGPVLVVGPVDEAGDLCPVERHALPQVLAAANGHTYQPGDAVEFVDDTVFMKNGRFARSVLKGTRTTVRSLSHDFIGVLLDDELVYGTAKFLRHVPAEAKADG